MHSHALLRINPAMIQLFPVGSLDLSGMSEVIDWGALFSLSKDFWTRHINEIESYFDEQIGDDLPSKMRMEIDLIRKRISE